MKTISELNEQVWYRFLKVAYIFVLSCLILISIFINANMGNSLFNAIKYSIYATIFWLVVFEVIKRAFYFIALGKLLPPTNR